MIDLFRKLAVHQAHVHRALRDPLPQAMAETLMEGLIYDATWLTKFPLLHTPGFDLPGLDAVNKGWVLGSVEPEAVRRHRVAVDADLVRFVLRLAPEQLDEKIEIFFGGRAMNKALGSYLAGWFEHAAVLRGRVASTSLFDTVYL